jgi:hypothetical protein
MLFPKTALLLSEKLIAVGTQNLTWVASQSSIKLSSFGRAMSSAAQSRTNLEAASGVEASNLSAEITSKLKDPSLLHAAGLIDGKWLGAWNSATYEVITSQTSLLGLCFNQLYRIQLSGKESCNGEGSSQDACDAS